MAKDEKNNEKLKDFLEKTYKENKKAINGGKFYKKKELCRRFRGKRVKIYYCLLKFADGRAYWKLGMTGRSVEERLKEIKQAAGGSCEIELIAFVEMSGLGGLLIEKYLHLWLKKYQTKEKILSSANSEVYVRDVLAFWVDWDEQD